MGRGGGRGYRNIFLLRQHFLPGRKCELSSLLLVLWFILYFFGFQSSPRGTLFFSVDVQCWMVGGEWCVANHFFFWIVIMMYNTGFYIIVYLYKYLDEEEKLVWVNFFIKLQNPNFPSLFQNPQKEMFFGKLYNPNKFAYFLYSKLLNTKRSARKPCSANSPRGLTKFFFYFYHVNENKVLFRSNG